MAGPTIRIVLAGDPDALKRALREAGAAAEDMGEDFGKAGDEMAGGVKAGAGKMGDILKGVAAVAATAAVAAGAVFAAGFVQGVEDEKANDKLAAQLGLSEATSAEMGKLAGDLYADAYGDSLTDVNEALRRVQLDGALTASDLGIDQVTARVMDLTSAFDQDLQPAVNAAGQLLKTGLAANATEAFDIITSGFQSGADRSDDFLDTLNEYSTNFRDLGLSGQEAIGLLIQGLQAGARDTDQVADGLAEFTKLAKENGTVTADAFKRIGLNGDDMARKISQGGPAAREALDKVFKGIAAIEDPALRAKTAVELFGTPVQDMAASFNNMNLGTAAEQLGEVGGAAERMGDTLNDNVSTKFESFKRTVTGAFVDFISEKVLPAANTLLDQVKPALDGVGEAIDLVTRIWSGETVETEEGTWQTTLVEWAVRAKDAFDALMQGLEPVFSFVSDNSEVFKQLGIVLLAVSLTITGVMLAAIVAFGVALAAIGLIVAVVIVAIKKVIDVAWDLAQNLKDAVATAWNKFIEFKDWMSELPGRIASAVGDLSRTLFDAGKNLIIGLWNGIVDKWDWLKRSVGDLLGGLRRLFPFSPAKEGPFSGTGYTTYAGRALVEDFAAGMQSGAGIARAAASNVTGAAQGVFAAGPAPAAATGAGAVSVAFTGNTSDALATVIMRLIREGKIQLSTAA